MSECVPGIWFIYINISLILHTTIPYIHLPSPTPNATIYEYNNNNNNNKIIFQYLMYFFLQFESVYTTYK